MSDSEGTESYIARAAAIQEMLRNKKDALTTYTNPADLHASFAGMQESLLLWGKERLRGAKDQLIQKLKNGEIPSKEDLVGIATNGLSTKIKENVDAVRSGLRRRKNEVLGIPDEEDDADETKEDNPDKRFKGKDDEDPTLTAAEAGADVDDDEYEEEETNALAEGRATNVPTSTTTTSSSGSGRQEQLSIENKIDGQLALPAPGNEKATETGNEGQLALEGGERSGQLALEGGDTTGQLALESPQNEGQLALEAAPAEDAEAETAEPDESFAPRTDLPDPDQEGQPLTTFNFKEGSGTNFEAPPSFNPSTTPRAPLPTKDEMSSRLVDSQLLTDRTQLMTSQMFTEE